MATYPSSPTVTIQGGWATPIGYSYGHDATDSTNQIARFDFLNAAGTVSNTNRKISFKWNGSQNQLNVNEYVTSSADGSDYPTVFKITPSGGTQGSIVGSGDTWVNISDNDTIHIYDDSGANSLIAYFVVSTSTNLWTGSGSSGGGSSGGQSGSGGQQPSTPSSSTKVFHNFW